MNHSGRIYYLVGPSGVGKDTLLNQLKKIEYTFNQPIVTHRYITRSVREDDENHIQLSEFDFNRRKEAGLFLFYWESHGNQYAIGKEVKKWVKSGINVIVNGSRQYLFTAQEISSRVIPIWLTVTEDILMKRLQARGRETEQEIEARIQRNQEMNLLKTNDCVTINNNQTVEDTIGQLLALMEISNN